MYTVKKHRASLENMQGLVFVNGELTHDLVEMCPVVDVGCKIHLDSKDIMVNKPSFGHSVPIHREDKNDL